MRTVSSDCVGVSKFCCGLSRRKHARRMSLIRSAACFVLQALWAIPLFAQTSVTTQHNDIARTGANTTETILTPANVNTAAFGKLFSLPVDGYVYAQPLYLPNVTIAGGTHNVIFVATEHDSVYAFDADGNLGANAHPLWHISLLDAAHGAASGATTMPSSDVSNTDLVPEIGVTSTPVIDPSSNTIYVVGVTKEGPTTYVQRLHALDIATGAEKFGGPRAIAASVAGNGNGSSGGTLNFDPKWEMNRPGLLLLNGIVYLAFGSHGDNGPWHGWVLAYNAKTLAQTGVWCATPNTGGAGTWLTGAGLAADVPDPAGHPNGRAFVPTGNGSFDATTPYTNAMDFGDSVVALDLSAMASAYPANATPADDFTPHEQATLNSSNHDPSSGGVLLLPKAVTGAQNLAIQGGKSGAVYLLNQDSLGGYHPGNTTDPQQKLQMTNAAQPPTNAALFSTAAYWNGNVYFWPVGGKLQAYSIANGVLSTSPTSTSSEAMAYPGSTASVSANGAANAIVWNVQTAGAATQNQAILYAHDATNVATTLYSSAQNTIRDSPGPAVKFAVPTVANGKVYVGTQNQISVYGLLNGATQAQAPVINPASENFRTPVQVTITDSTPGATIYYTTDGTAPSTGSLSHASPLTLTVSTTQTVQAMADGPGLLASPVSSATYTLLTQTATPVFNPAPGEYGSAQSVTITSSSGATIYYTTDGSTPTTSSTVYTGPVSVSSSLTLKAFATAPNLTNSAVASGQYIIDKNGATSVTYTDGFPASGMVLNGNALINGNVLQLTDGNPREAGSAWYPVQANVQSFTTDFEFQILPGISSPTSDGFTFAIQGSSTTAIGPSGGGLGYGGATGGITRSIAVKFDLFSNAGEGNNSTGLYTNGASPTVPATTLGGGINLHTTDIFHVHMSYDGATLAMTITDTSTNAVFTTSWPINVAATVGSIGYLGFTAATGGHAAIFDILNWTYTAGGGTQTQPAATPVISPATGTFSSAQTVSISDSTAGASIFYTLDGTTPSTSSTRYSGSFTVSSTTAVKAIATASGFTQSSVATSVITIQSGGGGSGINFGAGFSANGMQFNGHAALNGTRLQLTDTSVSAEVASAFWTTPVNITSFTNDFTFQLTSASADGFTFTLQNSKPTAIGPYGGGLGYGGTSGGIPNSIAVKFDLFSNAGEGNNSTGLYTNGASPTVPATTLGGGVNLHSGDILGVHMTYDGTTLTMTITDTSVPSQTFTTSWPIDIASTIGSVTAYAGFTAGDGGQRATQEILTWVYTPGGSSTPQTATPAISPATGTFSSPQSVTITDSTSSSSIFYTLDGSTPTTSSTLYSGPFSVSSTTTVKAIATASGFTQSSVATSVITIQSGGGGAINFSSGFTPTGMQFNGHTLLNGTRLQLTDVATTYEVASAFWATPVNISSFTNDFTFQLTNASADGFTFTIQGVAPTAIGPAGGGLGYGGTSGGIAKSVAVKFDLFSNAGEGTNSTGIYTNGAMPSVPATSLPSSINLHSGDTFHVHMTYDGITLAMTITDTATNAAFSTSWTINIPGTIGASTAYVGFTGATGGHLATQEMLTWSFGP